LSRRAAKLHVVAKFVEDVFIGERDRTIPS